jgi:tRNA (guanine10-N2)-dimethyltransferase
MLYYNKGCVYMDTRLYKDKIPHVMNSFRCGQYLYTTNCSTLERGLCALEMKCHFGIEPDRKDFITNIYVSPSRSPFIKHCISILYTASSLEELQNKIAADKLWAQTYKVYYINLEGEIPSYHDSKTAECEVGKCILGEAELDEPTTIFGITKREGCWIFGYCESNDCRWQKHKVKPFSYSNSLSVEVSRALVNIAVPNIGSTTLIDPCCGVGTVIVEALDQGIQVEGYEQNISIGWNAKKNLEHFGFESVITVGDMHTIEKHYDAAILDLPYGVFTSIKPVEQLALIKHTRKIAQRAVIITFEEMSEIISGCGFRITDTCTAAKGKFTRHIYLCA